MPGDPPSAPTSSTPKPPGRGRGTPRPRAGITRKSKAERDQFAKEEAARVAARAAEHEAANRGAKGGRVVNRGGRGGSPSIPRQGPVGGGGVFGGGSGVTTTQSKQKYEAFAELLDGGAKGRGLDALGQGGGDGTAGTAAQSKSGGRGGGVRGGNKPDAGVSNPVAEDEMIETSTDDEPDDGPKRDIEEIWLSSDEDDEPTTSSSRKGKQKATGSAKRPPQLTLALRPVRAPRTPREDDDDQDGKTPTTARRKRGSTGKTADIEPQEVSSDERDGEAMDIDPDFAPSIFRDPTSSPDLKKRTLKRQQPPIVPPARYARDAKGSTTETPDERAERLRTQEDVEKLRNIFLPPKTAVSSMDVDEGNDPSTSTGAESGQFILFQLPPLTPFLSDPSTAAAGAPDQEIKAEPAGLATANATIDLDTIPDAPPVAATSAATRPEDDNAAAMKHDLDSAAPQQPQLQTEGFLTASEPLRLPAGFVGKLNVHKSGKVTLDWGGTDMQVMLGTEVDFLQDVVLVTPPQNANEDGAQEADVEALGGRSNSRKVRDERGKAYALGHVRQKMVLIPDWAKLYD